MKPLPKQINKANMVELYSNQMSAKSILEEVRSFQEQCNISIHKQILHEEVKQLFFKRFGLPTGYEIKEDSKALKYE